MKYNEKGTIKQCLGKIRYIKADFAEEKAKEYTKLYFKEMRAYYCGICNGYHLTSKLRDQK